MPDSERRYSDAEMRRILANAASPDPDASSGHRADGHSLADIHELAAQVGIDAARVTRAAAALERPVATNTFLGFTLTLQGDRDVPLRLSREHMHIIAQEADHVLGGTGEVSQGSDWLEWHNRQRRTFVGVARGPARGRIRVITDHAHAFVASAGGIGLAGYLVAAGAAAHTSPAAGIVVSVGTAVATLGSIRLFWSWRTRSAVTRIQQALDTMHAAVVRAGATPSGSTDS